MNRLKKFFVLIATIILVFSFSGILSKTDAKSVSYMRLVDKNHQQYKYNDFITYLNPKYDKNKNQTSWTIYLDGIGGAFEKQTSKGYYDSFKDPVLKLPVKKNLTWKVENEQRKILSTKTTIKTKLKTFNNAVKVQVGISSEKHYQYFVPNYGMVKDTQKGKTVLELESITDRSGLKKTK